jgi:hypothetical protein
MIQINPRWLTALLFAAVASGCGGAGASGTGAPVLPGFSQTVHQSNSAPAGYPANVNSLRQLSQTSRANALREAFETRNGSSPVSTSITTYGAYLASLPLTERSRRADTSFSRVIYVLTSKIVRPLIAGKYVFFNGVHTELYDAASGDLLAITVDGQRMKR